MKNLKSAEITAQSSDVMHSAKRYQELHTTLPMADLINLFENEIREIVHYDSFEYEHPFQAIHIFRGTPKMHKCHYHIQAAELKLGQITVTRKTPFSEEEMHTIESALGALSIHLNNAFDYQKSLDDEHLQSLQMESQLSIIE